MQRLVSLKVGSKYLRNQCNNSPSLPSPGSNGLVSLSKTNPTNHLHSYSYTPIINQPHHFFSRFTAASRSWRSQNGVAEKIYGFLSNPVLVKQLSPKTVSKVSSKGLVDSGVGFLRDQLPKRIFEFNSSFEARRRGWQSWFRRQTADSVVLGLILTNVAVFMLWWIANRDFMRKNFTISVENFKSGRVHTLITSAFSHIDVWPLVSNMTNLYILGTVIGIHVGPKFLLRLYLSATVASSVFHLVCHAMYQNLLENLKDNQDEQMSSINSSRNAGMGAGGAVNAMFTAATIMRLNAILTSKAILFFKPILPSVPVLLPVLFLGIFVSIKDMQRIEEGEFHISESDRLGGTVVAVIALVRIKKGRF